MPELVDISIVIPTRDGGERLDQCLAAIGRQRTARPFEVVCVDSESAPEHVEIMRRHGVRMQRIRASDFDHGLSRDLGASLARGSVLVYLNGDAIPCDDSWLDELTTPLFESDRWAAVQGGIRSFPPGECFYWDSSEARFYITREMPRWIERHGGIGFSTLNAAIRRSVWERFPFGRAPFLEDKKWQRTITEARLEITTRPRAKVIHSHDYDWRAIARRCRNEGAGWRILGERYSLLDLLADLAAPHSYRQLLLGIRHGRIRSSAELLYPWIRPVMLHVGNRWPDDVQP